MCVFPSHCYIRGGSSGEDYSVEKTVALPGNASFILGSWSQTNFGLVGQVWLMFMNIY